MTERIHRSSREPGRPRPAKDKTTTTMPGAASRGVLDDAKMASDSLHTVVDVAAEVREIEVRSRPSGPRSIPSPALPLSTSAAAGRRQIAAIRAAFAGEEGQIAAAPAHPAIEETAAAAAPHGPLPSDAYGGGGREEGREGRLEGRRGGGTPGAARRRRLGGGRVSRVGGLDYIYHLFLLLDCVCCI